MDWAPTEHHVYHTISVRLPGETVAELMSFTAANSPFPDYRNDLSELVAAIVVDARKRPLSLYSFLVDMKRTLEGMRRQPPKPGGP